MSIDAMKQALEALNAGDNEVLPENYGQMVSDAILALRAALEQAQKPVAWMWADGTITTDPDRADGTWTPLYTAPRQWQWLTDEDREEILQWVEWKEIGSQPVAPQKLIAYVEKKLKEKNNG